MKRISIEQLQSIIKLGNNQDFKVILGWFRESLESIKDINLSNPDPRLGGEGLALKEILETVDNSRELQTRLSTTT